MIPRLVLTSCLCLTASSPAASLSDSLGAILSVREEGVGNASASEAWQSIVGTATFDDLAALTAALRDANPLAANYLRAAIDAVVDREVARGKSLPAETMAAQVLDSQAGEATRVAAFDLIQRGLPGTADRLVPGFLHDPAPPLRRLAVARLIGEAETAEDELTASLLYRQALVAARDVDQIKALATTLGKQGQEIDLPRQFGFLMHWDVIGPFDNTGREGFDRVYPPETEWKADAAYEGKTGEVRWQPLATSDPYGKVDLNKPYTTLKEVAAYARTVFTSDREQLVQLRLGCKNAWKVWVNGELLFGRDEYHRGQRIDQYIIPARFQAGPNVILVKCCQNEQTQDWTVQWEFQIRVCDDTGAAVLAPDRLPTPLPEAPRRRPATAP